MTFHSNNSTIFVLFIPSPTVDFTHHFISQISKFLTILGDIGKLESFLCDEKQWHEIFKFPASLNLSEIVTPICQANMTDILGLLSQQLDLQSVIPVVRKNLLLLNGLLRP